MTAETSAPFYVTKGEWEDLKNIVEEIRDDVRKVKETSGTNSIVLTRIVEPKLQLVEEHEVAIIRAKATLSTINWFIVALVPACSAIGGIVGFLISKVMR